MSKRVPVIWTVDEEASRRLCEEHSLPAGSVVVEQGAQNGVFTKRRIRGKIDEQRERGVASVDVGDA